MGISKIRLLGLISITLVVFAPALFNDFSGDDRYFLTQNTFYDHPGNIARLVSKDYNINSDAYFLQNSKDKGTGSVAYRPVLTLTYFFDKALWGDRAFGFHLTSLIFHLVNVMLVYVLLLRLLPGSAWLGACLFAVHPIQTEAVCAVGYRADLLAGLWCLLSFWAWIRFRERASVKYMIVSAAAYFLGVFSKESAVPLILALFLYDTMIWKKRGCLRPLRDYWAHAGILVFYFYIYFFVFRNTALAVLPESAASGGGSRAALEMFVIWGGYLRDFVWPFNVTLLPPLYAPDTNGSAWGLLAVPMLLTAGFLWGLIHALRRRSPTAFFLLWYAVFYLPISGLIRLPNPMAYRFVYLPAVGLTPVLGFVLQKFVGYARTGAGLKEARRIFIPALVISLAVCAFSLTFLWQNNFSIAGAWIKNFPGHFKGHEIMAKEYFSAGLYQEALPYYEKALSLRTSNPTSYYEAGQCLLKTGRGDEAFQYFQQTVALYPDYANGHFGMGRVYKLQGNYAQAIICFRSALELSAEKDAAYYFQLIDCYMKNGQRALAEEVLTCAGKNLGEDDYKRLLNSIKAQNGK